MTDQVRPLCHPFVISKYFLPSNSFIDLTIIYYEFIRKVYFFGDLGAIRKITDIIRNMRIAPI